MKTKRLVASLLLILGTILIVNPGVFAGTISRITTFTDGTVLYASDLNAEFNNIINAFNGGIDNDNIASNANISPLKISTNIVGSALTRDSGTGALSVVTDNVTIGVTANALTTIDGSVTTIKISSAAVTSEKIAIGGVTTQNIASGAVTTPKLALSSVTTQIIADHSVTNIKLPTVSASTTTGTLGNVAVSNGSGTFTTTSPSFVDVTNLDLTLPTTGRPVYLNLISTGATSYLGCAAVGPPNEMCACQVRFVADSSSLVSWIWASATDVDFESPTIPPSAFTHLHVTGAATHSYKVQLRIDTGSAPASQQCILVDTQLVAFEL